MKRGAPATEADVDSLLEAFSGPSAPPSTALQRLLADDPGGLALALALRVTGLDVEARRCAAVLLAEVCQRSDLARPADGVGSSVSGACFLRDDLSNALLEVLSAAAASPLVRRPAAEAVALAALGQYRQGRAWWELTARLARMSSGSRDDMATALEVLEVLRDEAESEKSTMVWVYAQLAALEEESGALHQLLGSSLMDTHAQEPLTDAAARVFCLCAVGDEVPEELQLGVTRGLAPQLAKAVVRDPREARLQALALSVQGDPFAWLQHQDSQLPFTLAKAASDASATLPVRQAALKALLQLFLAYKRGAEGLCDEETLELETHLVASIGSILAVTPSDEATDHWAEGADEEVGPAEDDSEVLLEDCLEDISCLIQHSEEARGAVRLASEQLLEQEAWQAKHGGLLLQLRAALEGQVDEDAAHSASSSARSFFAHAHPRVRWAAFEVWARLLASTPCIPCAELDQAAEQLCCACASDAYARVRRRGLLVLLQCSALHPQSMTKHLEKIRRVLEKACFADADCQQACVQIAEHLDLDSNGLQGLGPSHEADTIPAGQAHGIRDVVLQTEDPEELALLQRWCGYQGLRLHVTENERSGIDRFSTRFWSNHVNMTEEGRVAALNLVIGSRGVAVIGSLHSAWMKLQPAFMMAHQRKVVLVVGLASQDYQNFGSLSGSDAGAQQLLRPGEVFQAVPWLQNVARHPIS